MGGLRSRIAFGGHFRPELENEAIGFNLRGAAMVY
jgi:hypothetical protein